MNIRPALRWTTLAAVSTCDNYDVKAEISQLGEQISTAKLTACSTS